MRLIDICSLDDLVENSGVGVLVGDLQVAIFWDKHPESGELGEIYAIDNYDPIGGANVLSRGIICSFDDRLTVSSPLYKQHFCLSSGQCLQHPEIFVAVYKTELRGDRVFISEKALDLESIAA